MLGQKTKMTIPLGMQNKARRMEYSYDNTGRLIDMNIVPCNVASSQTSLETATLAAGDSFYYNSDQNRVKMITKNDPSSNYDGTYYFVYDPTASIPAVVYEQGPVNRYLNIREPDGSLISRETYNNSGIRTMSRTYHFDGLGSTVALTDENGQVTDTYGYDAWGNFAGHTGSTADNPYQYVGRYGYYTHYQDLKFNLLQLGVRFYDPQTGRFTQRDPANSQLMSSYIYGNDNVSVYIDPSGEIGICIRGKVGQDIWNKWDWTGPGNKSRKPHHFQRTIKVNTCPKKTCLKHLCHCTGHKIRTWGHADKYSGNLYYAIGNLQCDCPYVSGKLRDIGSISIGSGWFSTNIDLLSVLGSTLGQASDLKRTDSQWWHEDVKGTSWVNIDIYYY